LNFFGKKFVTWGTRYYVKTRKKTEKKKKKHVYFFKKSIFTKYRFEKRLTWHHVTSWCEYACRDVKEKLKFFYKRDIMWYHSRWDMRTKEFWMLSRWHYIPAHITQAMQCPCNVHPWNVIKVILHSSSHYPSDAMSMQCPCHGMLSRWHCILAHITQAMQCPCNVHAMESYQGDITF
jgi:hypothetical protein